MQRVLAEAGTPREHVTVASNPEFLREGQAVHDFLHPDRIVIGCEDPESAVRVSELYRGVHAPVLVTDPASAEMIKYASNAFLATKVSFINAIANLCEAVDADVREVAIGMGYDARIGFQFLHPGPGFGGSCFPKDVAALLHTAREAGYDFQLLDGVVERQPRPARADRRQGARRGRPTARRARDRDLGPHVQGRHRRPPRLAVARDRAQAARGRRDRARPTTRPRARRPRALMPELDVRPDPYEAAAGADVVALLTEWEELRWLDFERVRALMRRPGDRRCPEPARSRPRCAARGFEYSGVGRR